jgi:hypothetical protein
MTCVAAQVHVAQLRGTVYDPSGVRIPGASVRVQKDGNLLGEAQTDDRGGFAFKVRPGRYKLQAEMPGFQRMSQEIDVDLDLSTLLLPGHLRVVLGLGGTFCSYATTSTRQFKYDIKHFNDSLKEMQR